MTRKLLVVLNDPPYGTECSYNGPRLAGALTKRPDTENGVLQRRSASGVGRQPVLTTTPDLANYPRN